MKRKLLRLLPVAAVLLTASCTDDKYDLSEIDTTSQFAVKDLVVPLNMAPVKLDNIISIEDDGDIKTDKDGKYYFEKKCKEPFKSDPVDVKKITINKPADIHQNVTVAISLDPEIQSKWEQHAAGMSISDIKGDPTLMSTIGLTEDKEIISVTVSDTKDFNMNASNIDKKITSLDKLSIEPVALNVDVKLNGLKDVVEKVEITGLSIELPRGLTVTDNDNYNTADGKMSYDKLDIHEQRNIKATVEKLNYGIMKGDGANFDANAHTFTYNKACKVGGTATIKLSDLKDDATLNDIKNAVAASYSCDVWFSNNIVVNKFSGGIYHEVEGINIDPVDITNLPEILQEEGTSIEVANPQLYLRVTNPDFNKENPAFSNNFKIQAGLRIKGNEFMPKAEEGIVVALDGKTNNKVLSPEKDGLRYPTSIYDWIEFTDMRGLLSGSKIPEKLNIDIVNPVLKDDKVTDFELGKTYQGITGEWEFYAKLALTGNTRIKYTNEWDDWGSEDLDGLTVENATVFFKMTKGIELDADVTFTLNGEAMENGKMVEKKLKGETSLNMNEQEVKIPMTGGPIKNIKGGNIVVILKGKGKDISTKQTVEVSNLRMTVNGYYDKEF